MIRTMLAILLCLPLTSFAPIPDALPNATILPQHVQTIVVPRVQACTYETAPATARLRAHIVDPIGYPFGVVTAFSCAGDTLAVARELAERAAAMQEAAAAYRAAHPIAGTHP